MFFFPFFLKLSFCIWWYLLIYVFVDLLYCIRIWMNGMLWPHKLVTSECGWDSQNYGEFPTKRPQVSAILRLDNFWLEVWNMNFMTFHHIGNKNPKWLSHIFQRGWNTWNHQPDMIRYVVCIFSTQTTIHSVHATPSDAGLRGSPWDLRRLKGSLWDTKRLGWVKIDFDCQTLTIIDLSGFFLSPLSSSQCLANNRGFYESWWDVIKQKLALNMQNTIILSYFIQIGVLKQQILGL